MESTAGASGKRSGNALWIMGAPARAVTFFADTESEISRFPSLCLRFGDRKLYFETYAVKR